jgi:uncharacterized protein DUF4260
MVRFLLRLEGLAILALCVYGFAVTQGPWLWFAVLFLVPDLALLGYVRNPKVGATAYNLVHTYATAAVLFAIALALNVPALTFAALILGSHIGLDRLIGFGLKYPSSGRDTHLQRV